MHILQISKPLLSWVLEQHSRPAQTFATQPLRKELCDESSGCQAVNGMCPLTATQRLSELHTGPNKSCLWPFESYRRPPQVLTKIGRGACSSTLPVVQQLVPGVVAAFHCFDFKRVHNQRNQHYHTKATCLFDSFSQKETAVRVR